MDATTVQKLAWPRAIGIVFGIGTQLFFAVTVCFLFPFLRDGTTIIRGNWLLVDCLLALQFAIVHSLMLMPRVRVAISRILLGQFYGSIFCVTTCIGLWLTFTFWRCSPGTIWQCTGFSEMAMRAGFYASWAAMLVSLSVTGFGNQTGWTQWLYWYRRQPLPRRGFEESGIYRLFRHPGYCSFLGVIWFTPRMTIDHALLTSIWTAYVFAGSYVKDQRMLYYLGDTYREYASRVPGYPGVFFGPLGKWPRHCEIKPEPESGTTTVLPQVA